MEIVGEAAARVPPPVRAGIPLPWPRVVGMRNRVIHDDGPVDLEVLVETVRDRMPGLAQTVRAALRQPAGPAPRDGDAA